ncbi:MAG TPA: SUMF1/EgtB/PvdO family nonheme iron enzyme [Burkholderiaceae bacterium]|nr:SUMF1/EgtB/PvdO family nonheme iron enzyme [Burkholderiaceae bacterium]
MSAPGHVVRQYLDAAVRFSPSRGDGGAIRVARTLLTCRVAAEVLNELGVPQESETAYRYVNVHNPRCPLSFDAVEGRWSCTPALDDHPVWGINWAGAVLISEHLGGRLPSAEEWECIASNNEPTRTYPWGDDEPTPLRANYDEHYGATTAVASFPASELGLYDLAGNLCEWCRDSSDNGAGAPFEHIVKGGAWSKGARFLAIRTSRAKWGRLGTTTIGLRPVWDDAAR